MRGRIVVIGLLAVVVAAVAIFHFTQESTSKTALQPGEVSLVGDSLNVGVEPYLREELQRWLIVADDEVGRSTATGVEHVKGRGASLAPYVVVSLGTNDPVDAVDAFRADVAEVLRVAGSNRCVVWVTIHRDGDADEPFNEVLRAAASANRNLRLVEWASMIRAHPDFLAADGIHGTSDGYRARARAIVDALRACPPKQLRA